MMTLSVHRNNGLLNLHFTSCISIYMCVPSISMQHLLCVLYSGRECKKWCGGCNGSDSVRFILLVQGLKFSELGISR